MSDLGLCCATGCSPQKHASLCPESGWTDLISRMKWRFAIWDGHTKLVAHRLMQHWIAPVFSASNFLTKTGYAIFFMSYKSVPGVYPMRWVCIRRVQRPHNKTLLQRIRPWWAYQDTTPWDSRRWNPGFGRPHWAICYGLGGAICFLLHESLVSFNYGNM